MARCEQVSNERPQSSYQTFSKVFWNFLWSINVKNKYKNFIRKCILDQPYYIKENKTHL